MTVTKQQQLEWLAEYVKAWTWKSQIVHMSDGVVGWFHGPHVIAREEWQQERDKMQKQDNSWHARGELPPFNAVIEWDEWGNGNWVETKILADVGDGEFVMMIKGVKTIVGMPANFRPLRTEREKAIDAACVAAGGVGEDGLLIIERLYDAGMLK